MCTKLSRQVKDASLCVGKTFQKCKQRRVLLSQIQMMSRKTIDSLWHLLAFWAKRDGKKCRREAMNERKYQTSSYRSTINFFSLLLQQAKAQPGRRKTQKIHFILLLLSLWPSSSRFLKARHVAHYNVIIFIVFCYNFQFFIEKNFLLMEISNLLSSHLLTEQVISHVDGHFNAISLSTT